MATTYPTTIMAGTLMVAALFLMAVPGGSAQAPAVAPSPVVVAEEPASAPSVLAPSPSASLDCLNYFLNMSDCLTYVEAGSNLTKPDKGCCPELAGLVDSQPICLCQLLSNSTANLGIQINLNKALKLPSVCGVTTPSVSLCSAAGYPVGAPTSSEGPVSPAAGYPVGAPTSSEGPVSPGVSPPEGLAANPASGNFSGASSIAVSHISFLVGLAIAFLPSSF